MRLLVGYVSKNVAMASLLVFVGFVGLDVVFRIIGEADNIEKDYTFLLAVWFELLNTPTRIYEMMPLVGLIGCITGLGALANTSELTVMRSAGVSTFRLVFIAMLPAFVFMLAAMLVGEYLAPVTKQKAISMRAIALHKDTGVDLKRGLWLRDANDFVLVNVVQPNGRMLGVNIFSFNDARQLTEIRQAESATYQQGQWLLEDINITAFTAGDGRDLDNMLGVNIHAVTEQSLASLNWQTDLKPELLNLAVARPNELGMLNLHKYIQYLRAQSLNSIEYELAFWEKAFYPIVMFGLVLVGISFVFGPLRQVTMGYRVFWGVLTGVLFKTLQDTLAPLSIVFGFSPVVAMAVPAILCIALGLFFLARTR